jgi:polysaccharide biosynthesis/export protein
MRYSLPVLLAVCLLSSCVSNKKVQLMQKKDVNPGKRELPKDTVLRTYALDTFQYRLQANDIINIRFQTITNKDFDFFNQGANTVQQSSTIAVGGAQLIGDLIDENGQIPLPVVGKVKLAGLTVYQAQDTLEKIASRFVEDPIVKVRLMNYRITILGEVTTEGTTLLNNNRVSMLEAISHVGMTDLADRSNIKLIRQRGGQTEVVYLNLLSEDFFNSSYYYVHQNDVLVVPPLKQRPFRKYFTQNFSLALSTFSIATTIVLLVLNFTEK